MPGEFIAVADEIGIILPMNRQLLCDACQQLRAWQTLFPSNPPLTPIVNITAKQFAQAELASQIGEIFAANRNRSCLSQLGDHRNDRHGRRYAVCRRSLGTKSARRSSEHRRLRDRLLVSSRLQGFPVDTLKIDRAFISRIDTDLATHEIVRVIVMLAHGLRLKVVAEGIETQAQVDLLKDIGCELAQGYFYSRPIAAEAIEQLLSDNRAANVRITRAKTATSTSA